MTDKEFDNILKDALTSEEVPSELNRALLAKAQNKKKAKILTFTKSASAIAAIFICAVAVLSYYNSDMPRRAEEVSPEKAPVAEQTQKDIAETSAEEKAETAALPPTVQVPAAKGKAAPSRQKAAESGTTDLRNGIPAGDVYDAEIAAENAPAAHAEGAATEESAQDKASPPNTFSHSRKALPAALSGLFNEDYDYKAVINERISAQISALPNASEYTFLGISGEEAFLLNEENLLTIIFASGIAAPEEHGEQFFTVGTLTDGKLR